MTPTPEERDWLRNAPPDVRMSALCSEYEAKWRAAEQRAERAEGALAQHELPISRTLKRLLEAEQEIERLRAKVRGLEFEGDRLSGIAHRLRADAERLAEALRPIAETGGRLLWTFQNGESVLAEQRADEFWNAVIEAREVLRAWDERQK